MYSSNVSPAAPRVTTPALTQYPERRRVDRRHSIGSNVRAELNIDSLAPRRSGRRKTDAPMTPEMTARFDRNLRRRVIVNNIQADVEKKLGWAGVHGIRGLSGLGAAVATVVSVGMVMAAAFVPMVPGMGAVAFVGAYLAFTAIGVAIQMLARRGRVDLVEPHKQALITLRQTLLDEPDDFDDRQRGEEDAQLEVIQRLLNDIEGGFWWSMRCALAGFLEPAMTFKEGWRGLFGKKERRRADRRQNTERRSRSVPADNSRSRPAKTTK